MAKKQDKKTGKAWAKAHEEDILLIHRAGWPNKTTFWLQKITLWEFKKRCKLCEHTLLNAAFFK